MKRNSEIQYESERDVATRLIAEQYRSKGYGLPFHRNLEIYGVVDGEVTVTVAGDRKVCRGGGHCYYQLHGDARIQHNGRCRNILFAYRNAVSFRVQFPIQKRALAAFFVRRRAKPSDESNDKRHYRQSADFRT